MSRWTRKQVLWPQGWSGYASGPLAHVGNLAEEVYGEAARRDDTGLTAFAYLHRRFGMGYLGDTHKDLGLWVITTPHRDVLLTVRPDATCIAYGVGLIVSPGLAEEANRPHVERFNMLRKESLLEVCRRRGLDPDADYPEEVVQVVFAEADALLWDVDWLKTQPKRPPDVADERVADALRAALVDLLRPVYVRDVPICILGHEGMRGREAKAWME